MKPLSIIVFSTLLLALSSCNRNPQAEFSVDTLASNYKFYAFQFTNESDNVESVEWSFGDGRKSEELNPTHVFGQYGEYEVTMKAISKSGKEDEIKKQITVGFWGLKAIEFDVQNLNQNAVVNFADSMWLQCASFDVSDLDRIRISPVAEVSMPELKYSHNSAAGLPIPHFGHAFVPTSLTLLQGPSDECGETGLVFRRVGVDWSQPLGDENNLENYGRDGFADVVFEAEFDDDPYLFIVSEDLGTITCHLKAQIFYDDWMRDL